MPPTDDAANLLARIDAAGVNLRDLDPDNPDADHIIDERKQGDKRWLVAAAKRRRFLEVFAVRRDMAAAMEAVGWSRAQYAYAIKHDRRFAEEVFRIRGSRQGRPSRMTVMAQLIEDRERALAMASAGTPPPDVPELPPAEGEDGLMSWRGFAGFRKVFFGMDTHWFQQQIVEALEHSDPGSVTMILLPPEHGKAEEIGTPVPTPTGWTTMGELRVGDEVFDERGEVATVTYATPVHVRPCYRVTFTDGSDAVVSDHHRWLVRRRDRERRTTDERVRLTEVLTTEELVGAGVQRYGRPNFAVPVHDGFRLPDTDLPLDPWFLGAWLGDGGSDGSTFTVGDMDRAHMEALIRAAGWEPSREHRRGNCVMLGFVGLRSVIRALGLYRDKHIPATYLRASEKQRLALLQGLMDTDGSCSKTGQCEFTTTRVELADGAEELIRSLGFKVRRYGGRATIYGRDCGPKYRLSFYPRSDRPVFTLPRKYERQLSAGIVGDRERWQAIASIEGVGARLVRCIQVDSPSHLYVSGRNQKVSHNTSLLEDWIGYKLAVEPEFRVVYASEKQAHARKVIKRVKNRMHPSGPAPAYVERFGPFVPQTGEDARPQPWNQDFFDVWRRATSDERDYNMAGLGYGSAVAGTRCDLLVLDDVQSLKSLNLTDKIVEEFRQDWLSRPGTRGRTVILGTRVGELDFYAKVLEAELVDHLVKYPAIDGEGRFLWPERYSPSDYAKMQKKAGPSAWARNYQQQPSAAGDRTFDQRMLDEASDPLLRHSAAPSHIDGLRTCIVGHDPGFGTNAVFVAGVTADRFVALDWRVDKGLTSTAQMAQVIDDTMAHWLGQGVRPAHLVVEDKYVGQGFFADEAFLDLTRKYGCSMSGHRTGYSKYDDDLGVAAMARSFRVGEIVLPGADDDATARARAALDAELAAWRPNVKGTKLRQDLVMSMWFCWMRWRTQRMVAATDDRSAVIRLTGLGGVKPIPFRPVVTNTGALVGARR